MQRQRVNSRVLGLLMVGLVMRLLSPAGFMPGDLLAGDSLIVVCPNGLPSGFLDASHASSHEATQGVSVEADGGGRHHHSPDTDGIDSQSPDSSGHCPFGLVVDPQQTAPDILVTTLPGEKGRVGDLPPPTITTRIRTNLPIRGPPVIS